MDLRILGRGIECTLVKALSLAGVPLEDGILSKPPLGLLLLLAGAEDEEELVLAAMATCGGEVVVLCVVEGGDLDGSFPLPSSSSLLALVTELSVDELLPADLSLLARL